MQLEQLEEKSQLALMLHRSGALSEAEAVHRETVSRAPTNAYFKYRLAETLLAAGQRDEEALELMLDAARLDPNFPLFRDTAIRTMFRLWTPERAVECALALDAASGDGLSVGDRYALKRLGAVLLLERREVGLCFSAYRELFGHRATNIAIRGEFHGHQSVIVNYHSGGYEMYLPGDFWFRGFLLERLLAMQPAFDAVSGQGMLRLSVGDAADGDYDQLCFSSQRQNRVAVPDAIFFLENAYAGYRRAFAQLPSWRQRQPVAYWRGSLTGQATNIFEIMQLPRIGVCLAGRYDQRINAKITDFSQYSGFNPVLEETLRGLEVLGEHERGEENLKYRYLIDVDGNTNAWQSCYMKLLAGGLLVKIASPYRQWYYDRIVHRETAFLVNSPKEVLSAVHWAEANPRLAEEIALRGRDLAIAMDTKSGIEAFARSAEALLRGQFS